MHFSLGYKGVYKDTSWLDTASHCICKQTENFNLFAVMINSVLLCILTGASQRGVVPQYPIYHNNSSSPVTKTSGRNTVI